MRPLAHSQFRFSGASLAAVLTIAGAHSWSAQAVAAHKRKELKSAPRAHALWWVRGLFSLPAIDAMGLVLNLALGGGSAALVVGSVAYYIPTVLWVTPWWATPLIKGGLCLVGFGIGLFFLILVALSAIAGMVVRGPARWIKKPWRECATAGFPAEAKKIVGLVQEMRPSSQVFVHLLVQDSKLLDPILEIDGQYVLVWDKDGNIINPPR